MKSTFLHLNLKDLGKGLVVAGLTSASHVAYTSLQASTPIDIHSAATTGVLAMVAYLIKNVFTNSKDELLKGE